MIDNAGVSVRMKYFVCQVTPTRRTCRLANAPKDHDELTKEEIERRRDKIAKRMLNTPPKPRPPSPKKQKGVKKTSQ